MIYLFVIFLSSIISFRSLFGFLGAFPVCGYPNVVSERPIFFPIKALFIAFIISFIAILCFFSHTENKSVYIPYADKCFFVSYVVSMIVFYTGLIISNTSTKVDEFFDSFESYKGSRRNKWYICLVNW